MNKRSKIWASLAAGLMTLGIAGAALATDLGNQVGSKLGSYTQNCDNFPAIGAGEIGVHFILNFSGPGPHPTSALLDATFSTDSVSDVPNASHESSALHFYVVITGNADTTVLSASTDVDGNNLVISHVCGGQSSSSSSSSSSSTSFSSSQESSTTSVSSSSSSSSSSSASSSSSSTTSFSSSQQSTTTSITQPPTDTIGSGGPSNQATGMWLLVAALGVLLGSLVVLAPARAKNTR